MLPKTPKPLFWQYVKKGAAAVFVLEAIGFAVSYGVYYRMNTDTEFRHYMNQNFPLVLNYYYKVGEVLGNSRVRQTDLAIWQSEAQKKPE